MANKNNTIFVILEDYEYHGDMDITKHDTFVDAFKSRKSAIKKIAELKYQYTTSGPYSLEELNIDTDTPEEFECTEPCDMNFYYHAWIVERTLKD